MVLRSVQGAQNTSHFFPARWRPLEKSTSKSAQNRAVVPIEGSLDLSMGGGPFTDFHLSYG